MSDYIDRINLLDGLTSPEFGLDEVVDNLILEHNLDFLHDNNEDAVREFAKDLIESVQNYIKTESSADVEKVKYGSWERIADYGNGNCFGHCSVCGTRQQAENATALKVFYRRCRWCGAKMAVAR